MAARKGGKGSRQRSKIRRKLEKQKRRAVRKAEWERITGTDANKKKHHGRKMVKFNPQKHVHKVANCGNPGCKRCIKYLVKG